MKKIKNFFVTVLICFVFAGNINTFAMETGFSTEEMTQDEIERFFNNGHITRFTSEPAQEEIQCFDVDEDGMIAIGTGNAEKKKVCIYSNDGNFQYGYKFNTSGSFEVELNNHILNIYFVRSDVAVSINSNGEIEDIAKIRNTIENNTYWNQSVRAVKKIVGDEEYVLKNDIGFLGIFASSYSQLYKIDASGEKHLLYDVNTHQFVRSIIMFVGVLVFVSIVLVVIIREFKRLQLENKV